MYHRLGWIEIVLFIGVNIDLRSTRGLSGVCSNMHFHYLDHEQAQSYRACNIFMFGGFQSSIFIYIDSVHVVLASDNVLQKELFVAQSSD
jgi:hypothetical protein